MKCPCCNSEMYCAEANLENRACWNNNCPSRKVKYHPSVGVRDNWWFLERYHIPFYSHLFDHDWYCVESERTSGLTHCYSLDKTSFSGGKSKNFYVPYMALPAAEPDFHNAFWQLIRTCANASLNQPKPKPKPQKSQTKTAAGQYVYAKSKNNPYHIRFGFGVYTIGYNDEVIVQSKPVVESKPFTAPSKFPTITTMPVSVSSAWEVFGVVEKRSTHEEIKRRQKILLVAYHPDRHPNNRALAELHFKRVNEAYRILKQFHRWT